MKFVFLNGEFIQSEDAKVSIFDTGFYYGDGIYEVALLAGRKIIDLEGHFARLKYVLKEVKFNNSPSLDYLKDVIEKLVLKNSDIKDGLIYLQITRGMMENRYGDLRQIQSPTVLAYILPVNLEFDVEKKGINCELIEDPRRYRRDIKMTSLMPMNLSKIDALNKGYDYVIFKDRNTKAITEGASSNIFIVNQESVILTHPTGKKILSGCTRKKAIEFLKAAGHEVKEVEFFEEDLLEAKEAFITGAIKLFAPILTVNQIKIGDGSMEVAKFCMGKYQDFISTFKAI